MLDWFLILLLPLAAWSGWWVAMRKEARELRSNQSRAAYFEGLGFLLSDQTDRAVDAFLHMAEVDQQTLDNQLTLGRLFRKRGELDRALHLHQQLCRHENLSDMQRNAILYELAEDYNAAGMYNQAQVYFTKLLNQDSPALNVLEQLIHICARTREWQMAINYAERWQEQGFGSRKSDIAHYYCQLAEESISQEQSTFQTDQYLQKALQSDRSCVRAYWLQGKLLFSRGEFVNAVAALQSVGEYNLALLPDVLPELEKAYFMLDRKEEYLTWLCEKEAQAENFRLTLALIATLSANNKVAQIQELLKVRIKAKNNPLLLATYLRYFQSEHSLLAAFEKAIMPKTIYQCRECGFRQQRLIWHCPACFSWSSFQPVLELKVEQR